ncbi:uncharacterized protein LOC124275129 [Haliotis rubra]|uniref:uncharacterized protein LOC124275129 n=1 Tax=Haliotis rubra TaxID=36100 RepID=UPI001EE589B1|nr:uncharacterized protein LOC124275129 [Haliotis rubra]XP_046566575.1 uncharacterized protein LOC124275129 [Haliotis rubra]XP_046566576.1 uncharacterized protein LOC124275129 [Haliotis rubra]
MDPTQARQLFHLAEMNRTADGFLTKAEVADIFSAFDVNGDGTIVESEFTAHWQSRNLGSVLSAVYLFHRADTDQNGIITRTPDMDRVFSYFDLDDNGKVSEPEFVVVWASLTS